MAFAIISLVESFIFKSSYSFSFQCTLCVCVRLSFVFLDLIVSYQCLEIRNGLKYQTSGV